jgi:hypothetical protein
VYPERDGVRSFFHGVWGFLGVLLVGNVVVFDVYAVAALRAVS